MLAATACFTTPTTRSLTYRSCICLPSGDRASHYTTLAVDPTSQCTSQSTSKRVLSLPLFFNLLHRNLSVLSRSPHFQLHSLLLREIVFLSVSLCFPVSASRRPFTTQQPCFSLLSPLSSLSSTPSHRSSLTPQRSAFSAFSCLFSGP